MKNITQNLIVVTISCHLFFVSMQGRAEIISLSGKTDSIFSLLEKEKSKKITDQNDTLKIQLLLQLSEVTVYSNPLQALQYATEAKHNSKRIPVRRYGWKKAKYFSETLSSSAQAVYILGNLDKALLYSSAALKIREYLSRLPDKSISDDGRNGISSSCSNIGIIYAAKGDHQNAISYFMRALEIDSLVENKKGLVRNLGNIGIVYKDIGESEKALVFHKRALQLAEEADEIKGITHNLGSIGNIYKDRGEYPRALGYYFRMAELAERTGDQRSLSSACTNLGNLYSLKGELSKARVYYTRGLQIAQSTGNKLSEGTNLGNLANCYVQIGDSILSADGTTSMRDRMYEDALNYYKKGLDIAVETGHRSSIIANVGNIGLVYFGLGRFSEAEKNFKEAMDLAAKTGDKNSEAINLANLGALMIKTGRYDVAEEKLNESMKLTEQTGNRNLTKEIFLSRKELYAKQAKWNESLDAYKKYISLRDTLFSEEQEKEIVRKEMEFELEKEEQRAKIIHEKEIALAAVQNRKQKLVIRFYAAGGVLLSLMLIIAFYAYVQKRRSNRLLTDKNEKLRHAYNIIEEKNTAITDSITYAKRIQEAMLPEENIIHNFLSHEGRIDDDRLFILYQPRDIVSGDFYWFHQAGNRGVLAAADCTGHGVPGAFMSMIGNDLLNDIVAARGIMRPDEILNQLDFGVRNALRQDETHNNDGMDISLITIDREAKTIEYAGAKNPLICFRNNEPLVVPADKFGIGGREPEDYEKKFQLHKLDINVPTLVYLISDGFQDQFGGPKNSARGGSAFYGKKFMLKNLITLLGEIHLLPVERQKILLNQRLESWRGSGDQMDDILIIGVKF